MTTQTYNPSYDDTEDIERALVGRRIVSIERIPERELPRDSYSGELGDRAAITLDDGTVLHLDGHDGGCACSAGCYYLDTLADLSEVDNVITAVHFNNSPAGDDMKGDGTYSIFVVADDRRINLATFEGSDGNGYYGSGYYITIKRPVTTTKENE